MLGFPVGLVDDPFFLCQHRKPKLRVFKFHYGEAEIARSIELRRCKSNVWNPNSCCTGWKRISPLACAFWIFLICVQMWILQQSRFGELELNFGWSSTFGWGESSMFVGATMTWPPGWSMHHLHSIFSSKMRLHKNVNKIFPVDALEIIQESWFFSLPVINILNVLYL
jgi:hypothetical protein